MRPSRASFELPWLAFLRLCCGFVVATPSWFTAILKPSHRAHRPLKNWFQVMIIECWFHVCITRHTCYCMITLEDFPSFNSKDRNVSKPLKPQTSFSCVSKLQRNYLCSHNTRAYPGVSDRRAITSYYYYCLPSDNCRLNITHKSCKHSLFYTCLIHSHSTYA